MSSEILISISLIIAVSAVLTILARIIKQPPIVAYLIAGVISGPLLFNFVSSSSEIIQTFAGIGVALLLFIVGLSLDLRLLKEVGKVSVFAGFFEIIFTGGIVFLIAIGIGMKNISALYFGAALAFSSTVVVVKILSDKKEIDTLHGRIALGILIVEDFVAAIALMLVPLINSSQGYFVIFTKLGLAILIITLIFIFSNFVLNKFMNYLARSQEALFLFGIAWALILAALFEKLGFSLEIGALIAGMSLASSKYTLDLGGKIKPLRDFFIVIFFVFFGSQLVGPINIGLIKMAILFSLFVLIGKPLIVMTVLRIFGYKKRTNFLAGSSIAQISEFSLILILLGFTLGNINQEMMSLVVLIALITIGLSSYTIHYSGAIFNKISRFLGIFEGGGHPHKKSDEKKYDILLFGYHRIGYKILKSLNKMKIKFIVVDYNPKVILSLGRAGIDCIYGDAADKEFLNEINLKDFKMIISTIPDENSNLAIIEKLKEIKSDAIFLPTTENSRDALDLYHKGADFVIVPQHLGGNYIANMIENYSFDKKEYKSKGKIHMDEMLEGKKNSNYT